LKWLDVSPARCELALRLRDVGPRCLELAVKLRDARTLSASLATWRARYRRCARCSICRSSA